MRNIKLVVQYDGTDYAGYQKQPHALAIQEELERALAEVLQEPTRSIGASRTDAGVHALGQVVAVTTERPIPPSRLMRALNNTLPRAIAVIEAAEVSPEFHPRYGALGKLYSYRLLNRPTPAPLEARYTWHVAVPLDTELMAQGARQLLGRHDFSAFEATGGSVVDKVRRLDRLDCLRRGDVVEVLAHADGFLYMMVRNIVGTLVEVGKRRLAPEALGDILASRDRGNAGPTAPPQGLCLVRVDY